MVLASLALVSIEFTGCQYRSKQDSYVLIAPNLKLPYWKSVQEGFNQAAADYGVTATSDGPDAYDPAAEATAFSQAVRGRPKGILVSAADAGALRNDIASAIAAGIPVITVDSDAPQSARLYFIGTNNLEAGRLGGKRLVEQLHGKGNVVFFTIAGQPNIEERLKGYKDVLAGSPGIKIAQVVSIAGDMNSAFDRTQEFLGKTGNDKIDAFVSLESTSGTAVGETLKRLHVTGPIVIAMDVDPETLGMIADGTIDSTIAQRPYTMGYLGLKALDEAHHAHMKELKEFKTTYAVDPHAPFPSYVDTGSTLITKYNVDVYQHPTQAPAQ